MCGIADGNLWISFPQQRDLAEVQVIVRSRVLAHAMHDGQRLGAMSEEAHHHSVPAEVLSDRGKNLMAGVVREFLNDMGARKLKPPHTNRLPMAALNVFTLTSQQLSHLLSTTTRRLGMSTSTQFCLPTERLQ